MPPAVVGELTEIKLEPPRNYRLLSVLMPVYNESRTLRTIIARVLASPVALPIELVCVDDCSTDRTPKILAELAAADPRIKVFRQPHNQGKGAAIRAAIGHMTGDIAIIQDADLEYDPADYPAMLAPILQNKADAVFGSRFAAAEQRKVLLYWHSLANHMLTWMSNILNDINLTDMETCYKAIRSDILKRIPLKSDRFGIEPELTTRLAQWNIRLYEVPISYHGRSFAEGKKIGLKDAFSALWCLFKYRFLDTRFTTHAGYYILQSVRRAKGFNRWIHKQIQPFVGDRVLEAGCGIGNFTELLLAKDRLVCVDMDPFYVEMISRRFGHLENLRTVGGNLTDPDLWQQVADEQLDTVICLNVMEHIENDRSVLSHIHEILADGGHAIILVPCQPWLYGECDKTLGHYRRYTNQELRSKMEAAGFEILNLRQLNRLGTIGWYLSKITGRKTLTPGQMRIFERLLPLAKLMDWLKLGPGLSVVGIGRKGAARPVGGDSPASRQAAASKSEMVGASRA